MARDASPDHDQRHAGARRAVRETTIKPALERPADRDQTLHRRIVGDIENRILSGEWAPGRKIPFEVDLAAQYGCSRMTVNKALTQLAKAGLIARKKRAGSFVLQPRAQSAVLEIHDIEAEVHSLRQTYTFEILRRAVRPAGPDEIAAHEGPDPSPDLLDVTCLHCAGAQPFCLEERLVNLAIVPDAAEATFADAPPGKWLLARIPWTSAEHRIQAVEADTTLADLLDIRVGAACLVIERRTWNSSGWITHVRLAYPGDRHTLVATFTPAG